MAAFIGSHSIKSARRRLTGKSGSPPAPQAIDPRLNPSLDSEIQSEASVAGALAAQQANLQIAGACLNERVPSNAAPNGIEGLAAGLAGLFDSLENLACAPAGSEARRSFLQSGRALATQFTQAASRLTALEDELNASIQRDVDWANRNLADISGLNWLIMEAQTAGEPCAGPAARRAKTLEALSACVKISVLTAVDGAVNIAIAGVTMVSGPGTPDFLAAIADRSGSLKIQAQNAGTPLRMGGGTIAGKMEARDGALAELQKGINAMAARLIPHVNRVCGSGQPFFIGTCAADIAVHPAMARDPSRLPVGGSAGAQVLARQGNRTFPREYSRIIERLGGALARVNDNLSNSRVVTRMLANERGRAGRAGPGEKEADLRFYREAYAGSAKMMTELESLKPVN